MLILASAVTAVSAWLLYLRLQRIHRDKLFSAALPPDWLRILENNVPLYSRLPPDLRRQLHGCINLFLDEKQFYGCAGLQITDEIRLTIAGNAAILLLQRKNHRFPGFTSILVYPDTYVAEEVKYDGLVEVRRQSARAGESWQRGPVILSWTDIMDGVRDGHDGHNVVLHEFAHKLDEENAIMDGLPVLRNRADYQQWAKVLTREYAALRQSVERGEDTVLDDYATVSPPEFFAVATETFFEKPEQMKTRLPELYAQLERYYNMDPAAWHCTHH